MVFRREFHIELREPFYWIICKVRQVSLLLTSHSFRKAYFILIYSPRNIILLQHFRESFPVHISTVIYGIVNYMCLHITTLFCSDCSCPMEKSVGRSPGKGRTKILIKNCEGISELIIKRKVVPVIKT